jgi:ribonuclease T1
MPVVASSSARSPRLLAVLAAVIVLLLAAGWFVSRQGQRSPDASALVPTVRLADLPPQAQQTVARIAAGGPFPYSQDGIVFSNIEGLLPAQSTGYYHEYTVVTPGSPDRGARRIIAGRGGEEYYTDDHYASFREVLP